MPHAEEATEFTPSTYPPFPNSPTLKTVELETISLTRLTSNDLAEQTRAFEAFKSRGFVYLELPGTPNGDTIAADAEAIARVGEQFFHLPQEEKTAYKLRNKELFGYKTAGATRVDKSGTPDLAEFMNVGKNDMIAPSPDQIQRAWPDVILQNRALFAGYCRAAHAIGMGIMDMVADRLGVDREEVRKRHVLEERSGDLVRMTRGPPRKVADLPEIQTPSHTDFGTVTILMNWLGGLQVWSSSSRRPGVHQPDGEGEWLWVKPKENCAIINMGDAAVKFTNGVLCSGRHRVVPAPADQGLWPRYSVAYFVRPNDTCIMKTLEGSGVPPVEEEECFNAREWIYQQSLKLGQKYEDN